MKSLTLKRLLALLLTLAAVLGIAACGADEIEGIIDIAAALVGTVEDSTEPITSSSEQPETSESVEEAEAIAIDGSYTSCEEVALYIHTYGCLPSNFITKAEARKLGWEGGSLSEYSDKLAIGGDRFGNREGLLPEKDGRYYTECDIDTLGKDSRGAKRIVFSNDGLIYYTEDHYESFTLLYGEESQ